MHVDKAIHEGGAPRVQFRPLRLPWPRWGQDYSALGPVGDLPLARTLVYYDIMWDARVVRLDCCVKI